MRLNEHAAWLVATPGPPGHLLDLLEAPLGRAEIAASKTQVRIDDPDQRQVRKVIALRDQLRTDHNVDFARLHRADKLGGPLGRPNCVGGDYCGSRIGE